MAALANSLVPAADLNRISLHGFPLKSSDNSGLSYLSFSRVHPRNAKVTIGRNRCIVQAGFRDIGRPSSASIFVGGFVLGGLVAGTLGCLYAPQISKALVETDQKELMKKLPKFIYDEGKALEKTKTVLADKIAQLNAAIDGVSSQLRTEADSNNEAMEADEIEAVIQ